MLVYEEQFSKRLAELRIKKGVSARDMSLSIGQNPGYAEREVDSLRLTDGSLPERAEQLYKELKTILHEVHQITDD